MFTGSRQTSLRKMSHSDESVAPPREDLTQQVQNLIAALDEANELVRDLSARNEVLVSQLEEVPRLLDAQIGSLQQEITVANDRAELAYRQVQEIANSRIWRFLVWLAGIGLRARGGSRPRP